MVGSLSCPVLHPQRVGVESDDEADDTKDDHGHVACRKRAVFVVETTLFRLLRLQTVVFVPGHRKFDSIVPIQRFFWQPAAICLKYDRTQENSLNALYPATEA